MSDVLAAQHPPAMKVGGRRLSVTSRPKAHASSPPKAAAASDEAEATADYPRPAAPGEEHVHVPPQNEDDAPKKEKKHHHGSHDEKRLKEGVHRKVDATRPTRDANGAKGMFGAAGRIAQPMGKSLSV